MKRVTLLIILLLSAGLLNFRVSAQTQPRSRAIYGELLGASQGVGVNYDARFKKGVSDGFGWRAGLGFGYSYSSTFVAFTIADDKIDTFNQMFRLAVPLEVNYLLGKRNSKLETGAGVFFCLDRYTSDTGADPENDYGFSPYLSLGYRLVTSKGFLFRAGVLPSYHFGGGSLSLYPYLGFGWAF